MPSRSIVPDLTTVLVRRYHTLPLFSDISQYPLTVSLERTSLAVSIPILLEPSRSLFNSSKISEYQRMADALSQVTLESGKEPMVFSLCEWGRVRANWSSRRRDQLWERDPISVQLHR